MAIQSLFLAISMMLSTFEISSACDKKGCKIVPKYDGIQDAPDVIRTVCEVDDRTHSMIVGGLREREHVVKDGGVLDEWPLVYAEFDSILRNQNDVTVFKPKVFIPGGGIAGGRKRVGFVAIFC